MATFHGPEKYIVMQDETGVWAEAQRDWNEQASHRRCMVKVEAGAIERFRLVAEQFGFVEDEPPAPRLPAKPRRQG